MQLSLIHTKKKHVIADACITTTYDGAMVIYKIHAELQAPLAKQDTVTANSNFAKYTLPYKHGAVKARILLESAYNN